MSDDSKEKPGAAVLLGKKFAGEKFSTVKKAEITDEQLKVYAEDPDAIPIDSYFVSVRATDAVRQAMMLAHTNVRRATTAVFDEIFATF